jgi:hypothetical protein
MPDRTRSPHIRGAEEQRFWLKVDKTETCWIWRAALNDHGYGIFRRSNHTNIRSHRWAWEQVNGLVPNGLELDHLCRNRACCNPSHLEAVTHLTNSSRSQPGGRVWRSHITHCPQGHPYDAANTYRHKRGRACKACRNERLRAYRARKREVR